MNQRNEHVYQTGQEAYDRLTEYLSEAQKAKLRRELDTLRYSKEEKIQFAKKIQQGNWSELFTSIKRDEFPARLLGCLHEGMITTMQYVTSQMFYNVFTHPDNKAKEVKIEKIFNAEGKIIKNAMQKIEATMKLASSSFLAFLTRKKELGKQGLEFHRMTRLFSQKKAGDELDLPSEEFTTNFFDARIDMNAFQEADKAGHMDWATESEKNRFYALLSKLPASEQNFIILDDPFFDGYTISDKTSVTQQINYRLAFNIFSRLRINNRPKVMIPSAGMMQCYLEATRPTTRMPAVYRFGFSPVEGLYQTMKSGCRDKIICTALLPECAETEADGYPANMSFAEAELHDFYHETLCANIPVNDRKVFEKFIDQLRHIATENSSVYLYTDTFSEFIIDMEHRPYDRNINKSLFMKTLYASMKSTRPDMRLWLTLDANDLRCEPKIFAKEKTQDEARIEAIKMSVGESRKIVAPQIASWLLEQENTLFEKFDFDLSKLMDFPSDAYGLIAMVKNELRQKLAERVKNKSIEALLPMISAPERPGPLLLTSVKQAIEALVKQDITQAVLVAFKLKSDVMMKIIHKEFADNFIKYTESGVIDHLKETNFSELAYIMDAFCKTPYADTIMKNALSDKFHSSRDNIIDLLYRTERINHVYSDKTTLLQRALKAEHIELILRLTNDGASVVEVPGAVKPCPLVDAMRTGRNDLIVALIYAYKHGADWVQKFPKTVARIRRMAAPYEYNFLTYPEQDEDTQWALSIIKKSSLPSYLFDSIEDNYVSDVKETHVNVNRFFERLKNEGHMTLDMNDPAVEAFFRCKKWADEGGVLPTENTFKH